MISKPWIDYKLRINWWNKVDEVDGSENEVYGTETESWFRFGLTWFAVDELWTISAIFFLLKIEPSLYPSAMLEDFHSPCRFNDKRSIPFSAKFVAVA